MNEKAKAYVEERNTKNIRCNRCGSVVLTSDSKEYPYQCMFCDEDLYDIETHEGAEITEKEYEELVEQTADILLL